MKKFVLNYLKLIFFTFILILVLNCNLYSDNSPDIDIAVIPQEINNSIIYKNVNGDLNINIQDVVLIVNIILSNQSNDSADVNQDGNIDVLDIIHVVNLILQN